jgi:DNA-directed RNA polymerase specialized sigma subunit
LDLKHLLATVDVEVACKGYSHISNREILKMHFEQGMTLRAIGKHYGVASGAIGHRLSRIYKYLRERWDN